MSTTKITTLNFKLYPELKVQYVFKNGYCYFEKRQAEVYKKESKQDYETVTRKDADKEKALAAKRVEDLQAELEQLQAKLPELEKDETKGDDLAATSQRIETITAELNELKNA